MSDKKKDQSVSQVAKVFGCQSCGSPTAHPPYCPSCEYMTPQDAQKRLHISPSTYFRLVAAGKIAQRKIGRRKTLVSREAIDRLFYPGA